MLVFREPACVSNLAPHLNSLRLTVPSSHPWATYTVSVINSSVSLLNLILLNTRNSFQDLNYPPPLEIVFLNCLYCYPFSHLMYAEVLCFEFKYLRFLNFLLSVFIQMLITGLFYLLHARHYTRFLR